MKTHLLRFESDLVELEDLGLVVKNFATNRPVRLRGTVSFCANDNLQANTNAGLVESFTGSSKYKMSSSNQ